jgi:hypothetical protein
MHRQKLMTRKIANVVLSIIKREKRDLVEETDTREFLQV